MDEIDFSVLNPSCRDIASRGVKLERSKDYISAVECFSEAIRMDPNYLPLYVSRAGCYFSLEMYEEVFSDNLIFKSRV